MIKNIERTVNGADNLIDNARNAVVGASERAELGVGLAAEKVAEKTAVAADKVAEKAVYAADMVAEKAGYAAGVVAEKASVAGEYLREGAECATRAAHQRLQQAADLVDRGYVRARTDISRAADKTSEYIAENSGKAVLVAAASGFLLGFLATRRRAATL